MVTLIFGWRENLTPDENHRRIKKFSDALTTEPNHHHKNSPEIRADTIGDVTLVALHLENNSAPQNKAIPGSKKTAGLERHNHILIAADARLYNRPVLLEKSDLPTDNNTISDAALIATIYEKRGRKGLDLLDGDFAFALYDTRADQLICRRDHFGVRPLYYTHERGKRFVFSSLARGLTHTAVIPAKRNWDASFEMLSNRVILDDQTMIAGVKRLMPAHELVVDTAGLNTAPYWELKPPTSIDRSPNRQTWNAGFKAKFTQAVQKRLPAAASLASELSGGLDAASITATAGELLPSDDQHVFAYCNALSDSRDLEGMIDETAHAELVARGSNRITLTKIAYKPQDPSHLFTDQPDRIDGLSVISEDEICEHASKSGATTIFSGLGGDQAVSFHGHGAEAHALRTGDWKSVATALKKRADLAGNISAAKLFTVTLLKAALPGRLSHPLIRKLRGRSTQDETFKDMSCLKPLVRKPVPECCLMGGDIYRNQILDLTKGGIVGQLESRAAIAARHAVQHVYPMLDKELVEYALTCPPSFYIDGEMPRAPFRHTMKDVIPDEIRLRKNKLLPIPEIALDIAIRKADYLARADKLAKDTRLHRYIDFAHLKKRLKELPDEKQVRRTHKEAASRGEQGSMEYGACFLALGQAEALQRWLDEDPDGAP